jgi:signal transduction histidine kinase
MEKLRLEHENDLLLAQLETQESTFLNISQEIHDNIGLSLTLAKLNINSIDILDYKKSQTLLFNSNELISKAIADLSDLSKSFNAEVITNQGLLNSLERELSRIKLNLNYEVAYNVVGEPFHLDSQKEVLLFRIFQESMNNIIKHAGANRISVELKYTETEFKLTIADNGKGFNKEEVHSTRRNGAGIRNIFKRASLMHAVATIDSTLNFGTSINIKLPLNPTLQ